VKDAVLPPPPPQSDRPDALLILGPTGSGKSPLGDRLEAAGFRGRRCVHFDFGANLRAAAIRFAAAELTDREREVLVRSLQTGALLEDEDYPLALKILRAFLWERNAGRSDLIVLNGFPRHLGQAIALAPYLAVRLVVVLEAGAEVVRERLRRNAGGDRAGRVDDSDVEVDRKLEIFRSRTGPLADYYRSEGVPVILVPVGGETRPEDILARIEAGSAA
jgi:adenylate kinase